MPEPTDLVADFLKELVPKDLVEAAQLLVSLNYPIPDKKSLALQLEQRNTLNPQDQRADANSPRPTTEVIERVAGVFKPSDFGLDTPQSALEKFFARKDKDCPCSSPDELRPLGLPDFGGPGEPDPWLPTTPKEIEDALGTDACGRAAGREWLKVLNAFGPSEAEYVNIEAQRDRCRRLVEGLRVRGRCARTAQNVFALCFMSPRARYPRDIFMDRATVSECFRQALADYDRCRGILGEFGGDRPPGF